MLCEKIIFSKGNPSRGNQISNYFISDYCSSLVDAKEEILSKVDYAQDEITPYLDIRQKVRRYFEFFNLKLYLAIISVTIVGSVIFLILVYLAKFLTSFKNQNFVDNPYEFALAGVSCALLATWICGRFAVTAEGSGIAEMKSILTGIEIDDFFSITTLVTKYFSCILVKASGLGMGYEGAFIHIIGAFSSNITKLPFFKEVDDDHNRKSITIAGISAALVLAFGTPLGALFFALDMCPANFQLPNLFKCFISVSLAYFIWCVMYNIFNVTTVSKMTMVDDYNIGEIYWFILLGVVEGSLCTIYLIGFSKYLVFKRASTKPFFANRYYYIAIVTALVAFVTFDHNNFRWGAKEVISDLTTLVDLHDPARKIDWWYNDGRTISELCYVLLGRLLMFWSFSSASIPFGVFGPGLTIGVVIGRLYGETVCHLFALATKPNVFAACGCAAFLCGFTRSFTPLICVIEMTGEVRLLLPMLITNLIGFLFSSVWNIGFIEMIIAIRKLPYLPTFMPPERGMKPISEISESIGRDVLFLDSTLYDVFELLVLKTEVSNSEYIPIIDRGNCRIQSFVKLEDCFNYMKSTVIDIESIVMDHKEHMSFQLYIHLKKFVTDYGPDAQLIISKRIWAFLKKITMTTNKFQIGQFGTVTNHLPVKQNEHNYTNILLKEKVEGRMSDRFSYAFEIDLEKQEKTKKEEKDLHKKMITELLTNVKVDFNDPILCVNQVPIVVNETVKLIKAHYLFLMLGIQIIWVQQGTGKLVGKLTKNAFLKFKSA